MTSAPRLELLWWEGCPSTDRALSELRCAATELGLDAGAISLVEIRTEADAAHAAFIGSPTVLIDGFDVDRRSLAGAREDAGPEPSGLTCRVYRRRDGRFSPTPDPEDVRAALREAMRRPEVR